MLNCRKCRQPLRDGAAQQSMVEMESLLLTQLGPTSARSKAKGDGPLCDPCLDRWLQKRQALERNVPLTIE